MQKLLLTLLLAIFTQLNLMIDDSVVCRRLFCLEALDIISVDSDASLFLLFHNYTDVARVYTIQAHVKTTHAHHLYIWLCTQ
jgi:hypothetical protein